jgi:hypothetical protein
MVWIHDSTAWRDYCASAGERNGPDLCEYPENAGYWMKGAGNMQKKGITFETDANRVIFTDHLSLKDMASDCIDCKLNNNAALDYFPGSFCLRNIWLLNNGRERNDIF